VSTPCQRPRPVAVADPAGWPSCWGCGSSPWAARPAAGPRARRPVGQGAHDGPRPSRRGRGRARRGGGAGACRRWRWSRPPPAEGLSGMRRRQAGAEPARQADRTRAGWWSWAPVLQLLGNPEGRDDHRRALRRDPGTRRARTGLASRGRVGRRGPGARRRRLPRARPRASRQPARGVQPGWVRIYRRRAAPANLAGKRTIALGPDTRLGRTATALLEQLEKRPGSG
jgi:hypothetical protein